VDNLDQSLLHLLTKNARMPVSDLAKSLMVSRGTVQNRIAKLLQRKVIHRFTVQLGEADVDHQINAFTLVKFRANRNLPSLSAIRKISGVIDIHSLSGRFDYVVEIRTSSLPQLDGVLDDIRAIEDVAETQSHLRLASVK